MRRYVPLFLVAIVLGGLGGALGSMVGGRFGRSGLVAGGILGGLLAAVATGRLAASRGWVPKTRWRAVAFGAAAGFLAAAGVALNTLSSPVGPVLSTLLIGFGALLGTRGVMQDPSRG